MSHTHIDLHAVTDTTAIILPDPTTIDDVTRRRAQNAGLFAGGIAAFATSDFFKEGVHHVSLTQRPKAKRWDHRLSVESASREASSLKVTAQYLKTPGLISLGGGLPSSDYFPIQSLAVKVPRVSHFSEEETRASGLLLEMGKYDVSEGKGVYDLSIALNYGQGTGSAQMLRFVTEHTEAGVSLVSTGNVIDYVHHPPYQDWQCTMTVGSTSGLDVIFRTLLSRGDVLLTEEYTYSSAIESARPMGIRTVGIKMDEQGLIPAHLNQILTSWDAEKRKAKKPWVLYTVPTGQNPTGATQDAERRREIYNVAQRHDMLIIEDEPYYFLQMLPSSSAPPEEDNNTSTTTFLRSLLPSYLSMDSDGRVIRLDSFSKLLSPGLRTGWMTGPEQVIERVIRQHETSVQNPSGLSQLILHRLLDEHWGHEGFFRWLMWLRRQYTRRRDVVVKACQQGLPSEVVRWNVPTAGMFLWMHIECSSFVDEEGTMEMMEDRLFEKFVEKGVLLCKGRWFRADEVDGDGEESEEGKGVYFRATFAWGEEEMMREGIRRVGEALREYAV